MKSFGEAGKKPFLVDNRTENVEKADKEKDNAPLTKLERNRVIAILIVTVFSGIFWLIWYMAYMPVYYEFGPVSQGGSGWANWNIGSFEMPTAWFDSMNGLLCIILCPIFAGIWAKMRQRPQGDWGMFTKTAIGIIILGLCTGSMVLAAALSGHKRSSWYLGNHPGICMYVTRRSYLLTTWKRFHQQIRSKETSWNNAWCMATDHLLLW